ncbi:MAG: IclR family transcriptional regulator [Peptococcaceae bacterium]|nr:IclR family transcriptional regulator [Peptococcaceae bacterium]
MDEVSHSQDKYYIKSVFKAMDVLTCFTEKPEWSVKELSKALGMDRSTVNRLLVSLCAKGFAIKDPETGKYRLGMKIIEVAYGLLNQIDVRRVAVPVLKELAAKCLETVDLAIWYEDQTLFIEHLESPHQVKVASIVGDRMPPHCNSSGKIFLANLSRSELTRVLSKGLKRFTPNTITDPVELVKELDVVKETDVAFDFEEYSLEISACASAIRDHQGQVVAAVSIAGPSTRVNDKLSGEYAVLVKEAAQKISQMLGYQLPLANRGGMI